MSALRSDIPRLIEEMMFEHRTPPSPRTPRARSPPTSPPRPPDRQFDQEFLLRSQPDLPPVAPFPSLRTPSLIYEDAHPSRGGLGQTIQLDALIPTLDLERQTLVDRTLAHIAWRLDSLADQVSHSLWEFRMEAQTQLIHDQNQTMGLLLKACLSSNEGKKRGGGTFLPTAVVAPSLVFCPDSASALEEASKTIKEHRGQAASQAARLARVTELQQNGPLLQSIHIPAGAPADQFPMEDIFLRHAGTASSLVLVLRCRVSM